MYATTEIQKIFQQAKYERQQKFLADYRAGEIASYVEEETEEGGPTEEQRQRQEYMLLAGLY